MTAIEPFLTIRQASASYPVFVGRGLVDRVGTLVPVRGRVFVITPSSLRDRFGERVAASFPSSKVITTADGEESKSIETANGIVTALLDAGARRDSTAVVVGGGVTGDTAGFAAAVFLRGIDLVHVPTTLLAQVDSSIGGKVAVNHPKGKNLIGAFHPPRAVVCDLDTLDSLPPREMLSGLYEALKGGIIGDPSLFELFELTELDFEAIVRKSIAVKARIVSADERESDLRRLLNYGHTIAHGIEAALDYRGLTHGEAVAWGMIGANAIAVRRGLLGEAEEERIRKTILAWNPAPVPEVDRAVVLSATEHDKKNVGDRRVMVFPRRVGECVIVDDVTVEEITFGIEAALSAS